MLGDKLHIKKQRKYAFFLVEARQTMFNTHVLKVNINFQRKKKTFLKNYQTQRHYSFKDLFFRGMKSLVGTIKI